MELNEMIFLGACALGACADGTSSVYTIPDAVRIAKKVWEEVLKQDRNRND